MKKLLILILLLISYQGKAQSLFGPTIYISSWNQEPDSQKIGIITCTHSNHKQDSYVIQCDTNLYIVGDTIKALRNAIDYYKYVLNRQWR